ncbi:MAG: insulinase family protein [Acidobacteria bacterium]|nr:insulinase family protein [Acidobacteriota bacterium]MCA1649379.1 insulinase family protein [Acidobacteriota bacterium]
MAVDRSQLPALGPEPAFAFPGVQRRELENGVRVWTVEHRAVPLISFLVLLPAGASADPEARPGLAAMTGDLLDEGCGELNALELHEALGRIGAQIDTEVGSDATLLGLTTLERFADRGLALLADTVVRPRLDPQDFDRIRELRLNRLVQLRDMPQAIADRVFTQLVFAGHPYGHLPIGTEESLRAMQLDEVVEFHRRAYRAQRATVIAVGDATHDRLASMVEQAFADWRPPSSGPPFLDPATASAPGTPDVRVAIVHRGGATQSELRIGHVGLPRSTPDYHALLVLNMILGGQFVSRINMNLREDKGYTYGARTSFDFRRGAGPFVFQASVQSEVTADAVRETLAEIHAIRADRPVTHAELEAGRAALTRGYPRNFETAEQVGRSAAQLALYGLRDDYFSTFVPRVLALDEVDLTRVASAHIHPARLVTVVVGDRERVRPGLDALDLGRTEELPVT